MKNVISISFLIISFLLISSQKIKATNYFVSAAVTDIGVGYSNASAPSNIGCDAIITPACTSNANNQLTVTVSENSGARKFAWDDYGGNADSRALSYDVIDPDIALVNDANNNCNAIIVYYSSNQSAIIMEIWQWPLNGSSFGLTPLSVTPVAYVTPTAVNVDADNYGEFVVTWDDGSGNIYVRVGIINGMTPPWNGTTLCTISSPAGKFPDVAIHDDTQNTGNNSNVYLTYINTGSTDIYEFTETINNAKGGTFNNSDNLAYTPPSSTTLFAPRIAAASDLKDPIGQFDICPYWGIVVERDDATSSPLYDIIGFFYNGSSPTTRCYTNGVNGPAAINAYGNYKPAIAYDQVNSGAVVSWMSSYPNEHTNFIEDAPVAMAVTPDNGRDVSNQFMVVPTSNLNQMSNLQRPIALAGRHDKNMFYCWYDDSNSKISYKSVNISASSLKMGLTDKSFDLQIYPNPFTDCISVGEIDRFDSKISMMVIFCDISGRIILRKEITLDELEELLNCTVKSVSRGSYQLTILIKDKEMVINKKLIKI